MRQNERDNIFTKLHSGELKVERTENGKEFCAFGTGRKNLAADEFGVLLGVAGALGFYVGGGFFDGADVFGR
jgi:hypothetical protein